ncbi:hypothetical membrane spanning protein [Renibacterium salmoninarum ATCC 33209]|uniref:Hypothetical membrane spanning protein n=1 Tax=Renibacterium salmoninarum (strain ATCC 33209 / DSM 20767 / JCM 11484 / NBRC 15589 / NCIMB 2235) TaxID=288705 RepID=A9WUV1_RENSM|nr:DUF4233 domain-containing protein [Renibacterium salmoninarum]ABY24972.1 hypothetical membrane spanning protein [Renibacterium salmoninarum ATCC 33209]
MARQTKAQRGWRPGTPKKRRSTKVMFASTVLALEGFVAFFATLVIFGLRSREISPIAILTVGIALSVVLIGTCAFLTKQWGLWLGWILQLVLIAVGFLEPMMFVIGPLFAISWWYALRTGARLDRENLKREQDQLQWDKEHPGESDGLSSDSL